MPFHIEVGLTIFIICGGLAMAGIAACLVKDTFFPNRR